MIEPSTEGELIEAVTMAAGDGRKLIIQGGGSKAAVGQSVDATILSTRKISGIIDYDAPELVLTVRPGTALSEIEALTASQGQMLAFEPFDHGPIFGQASGRASIGGIIGAGVSGSRRLSAGGARDHLLGLRAVSGRGEAFLAGAKVVKNVTGYDLPKLATGSWGRLFALSEITLKVLPRPQVTRSMAIEGLPAGEASRAMSAAMGSQAEVAAAAHLPDHVQTERGLTLFRLEGFGPSVTAREKMLSAMLASFGVVHRLGEAEGDAFWGDVRTLARLPAAQALWRINIPPRALSTIVAAIVPFGASWLADWAGGLVWAACDGDAVLLREAVRHAGGHAMLIRAPAEMRSRVAAFHPQPDGVAALEERVRRAFDPVGVFETGRF